MNDNPARGRLRRWGGPAAIAAGGLLAGMVVAGTITAAADPTSSSTPESSTAQSDQPGAQPGGAAPRDESQSQRPDEHLLTGDTAEKVKAAALAKYPGATIQRVETDSDGVYEAHLVTTDGKRVTVEVGEDFAVTGEEAAGGPRK
ncbi:MAG TPA: PepSY domain-containing protein [Pseudonocardiaceae bacterium]|jgi:PKD repeat protein